MPQLSDGLISKDIASQHIASEKYLCETRLDYLCKEILGFQDWDKCHDEYREWDVEHLGNRYKLLLMPRGHLKSSIVSIAKTIQDILRAPDTRILLASAVWDNSRSLLHEIKAYLEQNRHLIQLYGNFKSDRWNNDEIIIKQRKRPNRTPTIDTAGIERTVTGFHYDIIRADDLVTRENITTTEQMEKVRNYLRDMIKLLEPNGTMEIIGTRWHDSDVYGHIIDELTTDKLGTDRFHVYKRRAIEDGNPIFPKKFSLETLKNIKIQVGSYEYAANYDNDPVDAENQKFKPPVRYWTTLGDEAVHTITVDPAISEKKDSCDAVVMDCAQTGANQLCVVDYAILKEKEKLPSRIIEKIFEMVLRYPNKDKSKVVGIEAVGYQAALCRLVEEEQRRRNIFFKVVEIRQHKDKNMRILELTPMWESGNLLLKQGMVELEDQLLRFPVSKKLDILDTLAMQLQVRRPQIERKAKVWIPKMFRKQAA